jgi:hypothetical protein
VQAKCGESVIATFGVRKTLCLHNLYDAHNPILTLFKNKTYNFVYVLYIRKMRLFAGFNVGYEEFYLLGYNAVHSDES